MKFTLPTILLSALALLAPTADAAAWDMKPTCIRVNSALDGSYEKAAYRALRDWCQNGDRLGRGHRTRAYYSADLQWRICNLDGNKNGDRCDSFSWDDMSKTLNRRCPLDGQITFGYVDVKSNEGKGKFRVGRAPGKMSDEEFCGW